MRIFKNLFRKKTIDEKVSDYGNYLCACMVSGEIDGKEATDELLYYKKSLEDD